MPSLLPTRPDGTGAQSQKRLPRKTDPFDQPLRSRKPKTAPQQAEIPAELSNPGECALLIADSKYTWAETDNVGITNQIRAMMHLAKDNGVPFVFLVTEGGNVTRGVRRYADQLGVEMHVIQRTSGRIR
jgi:hypothetical protein